jgi:hypothetical protein
MLSRTAWFICVLLMLYASFSFYPRWKKQEGNATISYDVSGYYWYLPSIFIYKDLKHQSFKDSIINKYRPSESDFQQGFKMENGNYVMKYASGMAVMYLPFFTMAHIAAGPLGYPRDGFSPPYQFAIQLGGFLISIIGLWYLRKLLLNFYNDKVVAIVMLLLVVGSNYIVYAAIDPGMSHCWLFTIYVFLLINTRYFYQTFQTKYAVRIGLLVGLATLTRPTDVISCLIPLLWGMETISPRAITHQFSTIIKNYKPLLIAVACAGLVVSIQFVYWKYASGHWLMYSYQDQHIYFRSPNFLNYTFSYRSGWLTYSPMMVFAFVGIIPLFKAGKNKVAIITFFLLNYYLVCAWSIWWYGGRAMVQSYPILAFPIAALVDVALQKKTLMWVLAPLAVVFVYYNIWFVYQSHKGDLFEVDNMSRAYFWRVAGKWEVPPETTLLKDNADQLASLPAHAQLNYQNNFDKDTGIIYQKDNNGIGQVMYLDHEHQESHIYRMPVKEINHHWARATATFHTGVREGIWWKMPQFIIRAIKGDSIVKENMVRVTRLLDHNETKNISIDMHFPDTNVDSVHVLFWNGGSDLPIWVDNLKVWTFEHD